MNRSMRWMLAVSLVFLTGTAMAQALQYWCPAEGVAYGVSFKHAGEHIAHVDAVTHQPAAEFQLPVWNALYQVRDFAVNVNHVKAYEGVPEWKCDRCDLRDATPSKRDKATWEITSSGLYPCVTFSYDVWLDDAGVFGSSLDAQHGFLNWAQVLVYRPDQRSSPVTVRLMDVPAGWKLRDGGVFGTRAAEELTNAEATAPSYDRLVDSPAMLGKLHQASFQQGGALYNVVVDSPDVNLDALQSMLQKITAAGVDWMQDRPYDEYTFLYLAAHGVDGGGMEHAYSTAIDVSAERLKQDVINAAGVSAHEFFHLWNVKRIRPQSLEPIDHARAQHSRALWFSEGVTNTVSDILLMRAGLSDEKHELAHLAAVIGGLQGRPARLSQSVEESSFDTWFDIYPSYKRPERSISYYSKGEVLGFLIDLEMRRLTNGRRCLRDLMQYMNQRYAKQGLYFDDSEGVRLALEVLTGDDFRQFFSRYVSGTEELPYDRVFSYVGLSLTHRQGEQVYAGFSAVRGLGRPATISHVEDGSAAARAHLAPGDVILEVDGKPLEGDFNQALQWHDPRREPIRLKVTPATGGAAREVELPLSTRKIDEYQFQELPNVTAEMRARRAAFLRGDADNASESTAKNAVEAPAR